MNKERHKYKISFIEIKSNQDIGKTYEVMKQLRNNLNKNDYISNINTMRAHQKSYTLIGAFLENQYIAAVGFSYDCRLSVGNMIYIEDLVVDENYQNLGIGKELMGYVEMVAKKKNIKTLVLDSAVHRKAAHKLYNKLGFVNTSNNYKKFLD
ncbi:MAG: GNAT family N-acetyltransferase [Alphaproteobacteria bacterium]|jgi:GNAT superfamily N-acetyltransferase|nr:GNAT family N-acetyltransferase [Alphaproteobacteria bacterium]